MLSPASSPTLMSALKNNSLKTFNSFDIQEMRIVETSMMSANAVYEVHCKQTDANGMEQPYKAFCSSAWKQLASTDWVLCSHTRAPY